MQSIKRRLYEANDDQTNCRHGTLDESSQTPLQLLSSSALATKRWQQALATKRGSSSRDPQSSKAIPARKVTFWSTRLGRNVLRCGQAGHNSRTCNVQTSEQQ
ncbi:hypothetical protein BASA62_003622 [Batrachochytrium salamandrivorans]|nr:hypothetical protein BASA62_003622 [Batrachochytrium salamandrivorans]